jgi:hypothetical protein
MIQPNKPFSFRPGALAALLTDWCELHKQTPSEATRIALAKMLGVDAPEMTVGNPDIAEQSISANKARWKSKRRRAKK